MQLMSQIRKVTYYLCERKGSAQYILKNHLHESLQSASECNERFNIAKTFKEIEESPHKLADKQAANAIRNKNIWKDFYINNKSVKECSEMYKLRPSRIIEIVSLWFRRFYSRLCLPERRDETNPLYEYVTSILWDDYKKFKICVQNVEELKNHLKYILEY